MLPCGRRRVRRGTSKGTLGAHPKRVLNGKHRPVYEKLLYGLQTDRKRLLRGTCKVQSQVRAALRATSTCLERVLKLIERCRRAAVIRQQGGLLAVRPRHTLKAAALYHARDCTLQPCVRSALDTTRGGQPTCRWRLASETALQRPRGRRWRWCKATSCRQSEGVTKPPQARHALQQSATC